MDVLVLDTNQIVEKDWYLRGAGMRLVEKAIGLSAVTVVVPEIVVEETVNKFRQRLIAKTEDVKDNVAKLEELLDSELPVPAPLIDVELQKYADRLNARLSELEVTRPGYATVPHNWLVPRALMPNRPFRNGDRGYRDALIWYSVLHEIASKDQTTYFVSANKKDFADQDGQWHPELLADIESAGLTGRVTLMHDLRVFVDNVVKPILEKVPSPLTISNFKTLFEEELNTIIVQLANAIDSGDLQGVPTELFEGAAYIYQLRLVSVESSEAYALNEELYYTAFDVFVEAYFDQTVYGPDAVWMAEDWGMSVMGGDEKTTDLSFSLTLPLTVAVITSTEPKVAPEITVELGEFFGFCRRCHAPLLSDSAERCPDCGRALFG